MSDRNRHTLARIANSAQRKLEHCKENTAEFGYYLGVMHLASVINTAMNQKSRVEFNLDYKVANKLWHSYRNDTQIQGQIDMNDLIPGILDRLENLNKILNKIINKDKK